MGPVRPREVPDVAFDVAQRVWVRHWPDGSDWARGRWTGDTQHVGRKCDMRECRGWGAGCKTPALHPTAPHPGPPQAHCEEVLLLV